MTVPSDCPRGPSPRFVPAVRLRGRLLQRFPRLEPYARLERLLYPEGNGHEFVERMTPEGRGAGRRISLACPVPHPGPVAPHPVMLSVSYGGGGTVTSDCPK